MILPNPVHWPKPENSVAGAKHCGQYLRHQSHHDSPLYAPVPTPRLVPSPQATSAPLHIDYKMYPCCIVCEGCYSHWFLWCCGEHPKQVEIKLTRHTGLVNPRLRKTVDVSKVFVQFCTSKLKQSVKFFTDNVNVEQTPSCQD